MANPASISKVTVSAWNSRSRVPAAGGSEPSLTLRKTCAPSWAPTARCTSAPQPHVVHGCRAPAFTAAAAGELRAHPDHTTLVIELPRRHRPPVVDLADHRVVADVDIVEEFCTDLRGAVELCDAPQRDSGMLDRHQEHGQAVVFGYVPIRAGQAQAIVSA